METIELDPVPAAEPCVHVGTDHYLARSKRECEVFLRMLERVFPIPEGLPVTYVIRSHPHDFGAYREVSVRYSGGDHAACDFAIHVESSVPVSWDPLAQQELRGVPVRRWCSRKSPAPIDCCRAAPRTRTPGHEPSLGTDRFSAVRPAHARQPRSSTYVLHFVY